MYTSFNRSRARRSLGERAIVFPWFPLVVGVVVVQVIFTLRVYLRTLAKSLSAPVTAARVHTRVIMHGYRFTMERRRQFAIGVGDPCNFQSTLPRAHYPRRSRGTDRLFFAFFWTCIIRGYRQVTRRTATAFNIEIALTRCATQMSVNGFNVCLVANI